MKKFTAIVIIFMTFFLMSALSVYADVIADELSLETNIIQNFSAYDSSGWIFYNYKAGNRGGDWDKVPSWAKPYISYCYTNGWIDGIELQGGRHIISDRNITRAEAAVLFDNYFYSIK